MSTKFKPPGAADESLANIGRQIASHYEIPLDKVRYATYRPFLGGHLTTTSRWERLLDGRWVDAEWMPDLHRTPAR